MRRTSNEDMLRTGGFGSLLLKLCLPAVLVTLVMVLYHMADIYFISQTGDPNKVAAVSLASPVFNALTGLGVLLGHGGCTAASLALGRGDRDRVRKISAFCLWGSLAMGAAGAAASLALLRPLCGLLGADADTMALTMDYLRVCLLGAPAILFANVAPALIRADGSSGAAMAGNFIGTGVNLALDPVLILLLNQGVSGAALATVLGNMAAALFYVRFLRSHRETYSASLRDFAPRGEIVGRVLSLGLPMSCSTLLMCVSSAVANGRMLVYGATALAAQSVAGKIGMIVSMVVMGICIGMQPAISFNYGAGDRRRLRAIVWKTGVTVVGVGAALSGLCLLFSGRLLAAFMRDEAVLRVGKCCLYSAALSGPVFGIYQMCATYLQATGQSGRAIAAALLEKGLIYLPALLLMEAAFGMNGIIFSGAVTTLLSTVAAALLCRKAVKEGKGHEQGEKRAISGNRPAHTGVCAG